MKGALRLERLRGAACALAALCCVVSTPLVPANAQAARNASIEQLTAEVVPLLVQEPEQSRRQLLVNLVSAFVAHGRVCESIELIRAAKGEEMLYVHPARVLAAAGLPDSALAVVAMMSRERQAGAQVSVFWGLTDTARILDLASRLPRGPSRANALANASRTESLGPLERRALLHHALDEAVEQPVDPWALLTVARYLWALDDLSAARLADQDSAVITTRMYPRFVVDLAANLRAKGNPLADSVYARARQLSEYNDRYRSSDMPNYWEHYLPSLADTNPMRLLPEVSASSQRVFLMGIMSIHLASAKVEVPFRVFDQLLASGDSARAIELLMSPYVNHIDQYLWQPRGSDAVKDTILARAVEVADQLADASRFQWLRQHRALRRQPGGTLVPLTELPLSEPEASAPRPARVSARDTALYWDSWRLNKDRRRLLATIDSIDDRRLQARALLHAAAIHARDGDTSLQRRAIESALAAFDPARDFQSLVDELYPVMLRLGMDQTAIKWARRWPPETRVHAITALLVVMTKSHVN